jgi:hypothetical protein
MKIITSNPVFQSGNDKSPSDMYYNFNPGAIAMSAQNAAQNASQYQSSQAGKGLTWDKAKGAWVKAKESGLIDKGMQLFGGLFGKGKPKGKPPISTGGNTRPPTKKKDKGMSTTTIVLIGVGVLVAGFAIYKLSKK